MLATANTSSAMFGTPAVSIADLCDEDAGVSKYQPEPKRESKGLGAEMASGRMVDMLARRRHSVAVPGK